MTLLYRLTLVCVALLISLSTHAHEYQVGDLTVDHPWTRATAPGAPVGGGFFVVRNNGAADDVLIDGEAPFARRTEVHQSKMEDGVMKMQKVNGGLPIPAGQSVMLNPGNFHLMFMGLTERLVEGEKVPVTLHFKEAGSITVEFIVDAPGKKAHDH